MPLSRGWQRKTEQSSFAGMPSAKPRSIQVVGWHSKLAGVSRMPEFAFRFHWTAMAQKRYSVLLWKQGVTSLRGVALDWVGASFVGRVRRFANFGNEENCMRAILCAALFAS